MKDTITIRRNGRTWGVYFDDKLVEGGFFTLAGADRAAEDLQARTGKQIR